VFNQPSAAQGGQAGGPQNPEDKKDKGPEEGQYKEK